MLRRASLLGILMVVVGCAHRWNATVTFETCRPDDLPASLIVVDDAVQEGTGVAPLELFIPRTSLRPGEIRWTGLPGPVWAVFLRPPPGPPSRHKMQISIDGVVRLTEVNARGVRGSYRVEFRGAPPVQGLIEARVRHDDMPVPVFCP
jgi:hypothetical protein